MVKKIGRFALRNDGLMLGKDFARYFKPNTVYEIIEFLGELVIKEVGPSETGEPDGKHPHNWGHDVNSIVEGGFHLYTEKEYMLLCDRVMED